METTVLLGVYKCTPSHTCAHPPIPTNHTHLRKRLTLTSVWMMVRFSRAINNPITIPSNLMVADSRAYDRQVVKACTHTTNLRMV
jgi:hypothetical protein